MLIMTVYLRVPPEAVGELRPHMKAVIAATRREPGCVFYALAEDLAEPGLIRAFEIFRDEAALKAHWDSDHMGAWRAASGQYPREGRTFYNADTRGPPG